MDTNERAVDESYFNTYVSAINSPNRAAYWATNNATVGAAYLDAYRTLFTTNHATFE